MDDALARLLTEMAGHGVERVYAKSLAPNDNSKNQVYLGDDFSALNILPHGEIFTDDDPRAGAVRRRTKAQLDLAWLTADGLRPAPHANLILYPKYPEVRMSGFLRDSHGAPSSLMASREPGRLLFLGTGRDNRILAHAAGPETEEARAVVRGDWPTLGVFLQLPAGTRRVSTKDALLSQLQRICAMGPVPSVRLDASGTRIPYVAMNGGGYTLEAELGISPNGMAEPDFMGWEVKQYGVAESGSPRAKSPITLMTPEPNGGLYRTQGVENFVRRFGYADRSGIPDRIDFGGRYDGRTPANALTGLRMELHGYDRNRGAIDDIDGRVALVTTQGEAAASWSFRSLMNHWNRKHAQAVYVPSNRLPGTASYSYGPTVLLCEGTDFLRFLRGLAEGTVFYDPAIKLEAASTRPTTKRRSQFRVSLADLPGLYASHETLAL